MIEKQSERKIKPTRLYVSISGLFCTLMITIFLLSARIHRKTLIICIVISSWFVAETIEPENLRWGLQRSVREMNEKFSRVGGVLYRNTKKSSLSEGDTFSPDRAFKKVDFFQRSHSLDERHLCSRTRIAYKFVLRN